MEHRQQFLLLPDVFRVSWSVIAKVSINGGLHAAHDLQELAVVVFVGFLWSRLRGLFV